jgi:RNA polymerase sigma factor (sigma-70 family)
MTKREEELELKQYEPLVRKIAHTYYLKYGKKYDIEDLEQVARMGVLAAIRNYDPQFKTKKLTHYYNYAGFYIKHHLRADTGMIHIPAKHMSDPEFQKPLIAGIEDYHTVKEDSDQIINLDNTFELEEYYSVLTDYQKEIIKKVYLEGFTFDEIAKQHKVTRQAVNLAATNGMNKMKQYANGVAVKTKSKPNTL